jgi:diaminopimelate epimerase
MRFVKLHGAGNDYIYVDARESAIGRQSPDWPEVARRVSDRHFGIGSDGLILLRESEVAHARMQMFNADGSEGLMCGNGIRCLVLFGLERNALPSGQDAFDVETASGILNVRPIWSEGVMTRASVSMGAPRLGASEIPVNAPYTGNGVVDYPLNVAGHDLLLTCVSMGNPHAVAFLGDAVEDFPLTAVGPMVERDPMFHEGVNFEIVNIVDPARIRVRVWERGSGITLACGTGACAAVVAARIHGLVEDEVSVELPGGELNVAWSGEGEVTMEGPVARVFEGEWPE